MTDTQKNGFWIALAVPGIIWLALLFIVPFYAVLAIAMGKLDQLYRVPGRGLEPVQLEFVERHRRVARPVRQRLVRRPVVVATLIYVAIASAALPG